VHILAVQSQDHFAEAHAKFKDRDLAGGGDAAVAGLRLLLQRYVYFCHCEDACGLTYHNSVRQIHQKSYVDGDREEARAKWVARWDGSV